MEVRTKAINHKGKKHIALNYSFNKEVNDLIRTIRGRRWSASRGLWHLPDSIRIDELNKRFSGKLKFSEQKQTNYFGVLRLNQKIKFKTKSNERRCKNRNTIY